MQDPGPARRPLRLLLRLLLILLTPLLFVGGHDALSPRSFKLAWQLGHPLLFFAAAALLVMPGGRLAHTPWTVRVGGALAVALVLGVAIEALQSLVGRQASLDDLRLDLIGAALGASGFAAPATPLQTRLRRACLAAALMLLAALDLRPLAIALADENRARNDFPRLADFRTSTELGRWSSEYAMAIVPSPGGAPGPVLRVTLGPGAYPGVYLRHFPRDWSRHEVMRFGIFAASDVPVALTCLVTDSAHDRANSYYDRFNLRLDVGAQWQWVERPLASIRAGPRERELDLRNIASFGCVGMQLDRRLDIYLRDVGLGQSSACASPCKKRDGSATDSAQ